MGLSSAAVATIISSIRKKWYSNDLSIMETVLECILEVEKENA
jgi:biopolymer transport protein ExbB/TolQ